MGVCVTVGVVVDVRVEVLVAVVVGVAVNVTVAVGTVVLTCKLTPRSQSIRMAATGYQHNPSQARSWSKNANPFNECTSIGKSSARFLYRISPLSLES